MDDKQLFDVAHRVVSGAKRRGIPDVKVVVGQSRSVSITYRKGQVDKVEESNRRSVTLHLYDNGKYSASTSNDLRPDAMERFLDSAVAMTAAMVPDPYRFLTDPALYAGREDRDLQLYDPQVASYSTAAMHRWAKEAEAAAREAAGDRAISGEANVEIQEGRSVQLHSNGFEGSKEGTQIWGFAEVSLRDEGDKRPSAWEVSGARFAKDLADPASVGRSAARRALEKLGSHKIPTRKCPMIVENRAVARLMNGLLSALSGGALQQKRSFLEGKQGAAIGSSLLSLRDDPFLPKGFGSRLFDSEGIAAKPFWVVERGVLRNYYIDTYYGKKLDMPPTTGDTSNLVLEPGDKSLETLISGVEDGILVQGFIGGNANTTTGDFSLGVYGRLIEKGALGPAVSELNIAGNHKTLWHHLVAVGADVWPHSSLRFPSVLFDEIQFSGS